MHLDDICPGWDGLRHVSRIAAETIAKPLKNRRPARWRRWDWERNQYGEARETLWAPIVMLEGCGAGTQPLRSYASTSIWIEAVVDVRQNRIKGRNDWPRYEEYADSWAIQEDELYAVDRTREHADLVVR